VLGEFLLPCEAMVIGDGTATRFLRHRNLVVRATVVMPRPFDESANTMALATATDLALSVLTHAGEPGPQRSGTC
jgi:hypothetical protein